MDRKQMVFAGSWYPETQTECLDFISTALAENTNSSIEPSAKLQFVGGIVPHAGWYFSGSIACRVISAVSQGGPVETVVLFGAHMHGDSEPFLLSRGAVETPFGEIRVDEEFSGQLCRESGIDARSPAKFPDENTFELQYPFIRHFFPDAHIVVCAVPPNDRAMDIGREAAGVANRLGRKIRVIGSTDMTHYGPNFGMIDAGSGREAVRWVEKENDREAIRAMLAMEPSRVISTGISKRSMCCPGAAAAAVAACIEMGAADAMELDYATSFEKSPSDSFVGYAGILYRMASGI